MVRLKTIISAIFLLVSITLTWHVISYAKENQRLKNDYAEINHFKYGLFSVNEWKDRISVIISDEINKVSLTKENEKILRAQLEQQLTVLIKQVLKRIEKENYKTPQGQIKQGIFKAFVNEKDVLKGVPEYADAILKEIRKGRTQNQLKTLLKEKIDKFLEKTYDSHGDSLRMRILKRMKTSDAEEARLKLSTIINEKSLMIRKFSLIIIILSLVTFMLEAFTKGPLRQTQYFILTFTLLILLASGVTTPMIDMEARIDNFKFVLFDHEILFKNQVLYFQSKSIQDVFWIMITHKDMEMKLVGILLVCFSIVFPVFKLLSSMAYYYDYCGAKKYKLIQFFVLKSGKWSMADVLVVAIFMAYIGFNGIIDSQMNDLRISAEGVNVLTTNGTNLQPGFYMFLTYTILAMFLSGYLKKRPLRCENGPL